MNRRHLLSTLVVASVMCASGKGYALGSQEEIGESAVNGDAVVMQCSFDNGWTPIFKIEHGAWLVWSNYVMPYAGEGRRWSGDVCGTTSEFVDRVYMDDDKRVEVKCDLSADRFHRAVTKKTHGFDGRVIGERVDSIWIARLDGSAKSGHHRTMYKQEPKSEYIQGKCKPTTDPVLVPAPLPPKNLL